MTILIQMSNRIEREKTQKIKKSQHTKKKTETYCARTGWQFPLVKNWKKLDKQVLIKSK